ncbi:PAS domain-containing protein [Thiomicrospira sp.]|uniref:PAS domain-containing protein n=1 Tax=Thiomicrospira sp. TaxID=935 RepID=UPI002F93526F
MQEKDSALLDSLPDMIFVYDETGTYLDVKGGKDSQHYSQTHSLVGKSVHDVLSKADAHRIVAHIGYAIELQGVVEFEYEIDHYSLYPDSGLNKQWYRARIRPLDASIYNTPAVVCMVSNITREKVFQSQLFEYIEVDPSLDVRVLNHRAFSDFVKEIESGASSALTSQSQATIWIEGFERIEAMADTKTLKNLENSVISALWRVRHDASYQVGRMCFGQYVVTANISPHNLQSSIKTTLASIDGKTVSLRNGESVAIQFEIADK